MEWVSGMTTLGQVVESEGACACSTTYEVEAVTEGGSKNNNSFGSSNTGASAAVPGSKSSSTPLPSATATNAAASTAPLAAGASAPGATSQSSSHLQPPAQAQLQAPAQAPAEVAPLTAAAKAGPTGRRLTLMLSRTMKKMRQNLIAGLLDHEICTHGGLHALFLLQSLLK